MIEENLKMEHTDKHLLFHNLWVYMVNHNFNKELEKIVSDEEIRMYEKYNLNDKEGLEKRLKFLDEKIPKLFEIVQKDIDKDGKQQNLAIKDSKITIEYAKSYNEKNMHKSYKIEVIYDSDKTSAREYYIDVNNGNIVYVAYYK